MTGIQPLAAVTTCNVHNCMVHTALSKYKVFGALCNVCNVHYQHLKSTHGEEKRTKSMICISKCVSTVDLSRLFDIKIKGLKTCFQLKEEENY